MQIFPSSSGQSNMNDPSEDASRNRIGRPITYALAAAIVMCAVPLSYRVAFCPNFTGYFSLDKLFSFSCKVNDAQIDNFKFDESHHNNWLNYNGKTAVPCSLVQEWLSRHELSRFTGALTTVENRLILRNIDSFASNEILIGSDGKIMWNGSVVTKSILQQYIDVTDQMMPRPTLVVKPVAAANCKSVADILGLIQNNTTVLIGDI